MSKLVSISGEPATAVTADAIVIGLRTGADAPVLARGSAELDAAFGGTLAGTARVLGAHGTAGEVTTIPAPPGAAAPLVLAVGLGDAAEPDDETLRRAAGVAARRCAGLSAVVMALPADTPERVAAVVGGALLGRYAFLRYRTGEQARPVGSVTVIAADDPAVRAAAEHAETVADAVSLVRDLVNTPANDLYPQTFAEIARGVAERAGVDIEVLDERQLRELGYGGLTAVGKGSVRPPRLVRLSYAHPEAAKTVTFVGKGITFDTGGLSLKSTQGSMDWMKSDMGGAGAVLGAIRAIAELRVPVRAIGYLCLAENMPGGGAQRPSDVFTGFGGTTVEVRDTDAEGRLVLSDGLSRALRDDPDLLVDIATLTGGQLTALGTRTSGVMGNDDAVREQVVASSAAAGESMWGMPLLEELRGYFDSSIADIANHASERYGSMMAAGAFLNEFVPAEVRWAHIDIAGPSFNKSEPYGYVPKGGTGVGTRTLVRIAEDLAAGRL